MPRAAARCRSVPFHKSLATRRGCGICPHCTSPLCTPAASRRLYTRCPVFGRAARHPGSCLRAGPRCPARASQRSACPRPSTTAARMAGGVGDAHRPAAAGACRSPARRRQRSRPPNPSSRSSAPARSWSASTSRSTGRNDDPVTDLQASDFVVTEDEIPQTVETVQFVRLDGQRKVDNGESLEIRGHDARPLVEAAKEDVRLFAIFLDDYHIDRAPDDHDPAAQGARGLRRAACSRRTSWS